MKEIKGKEKSVRMLLESTRFSIDYYQREYKWQNKQLRELIEDFSEKFLDSFEPGDERSAIQTYENYFLGSIILCEKDGQKFIIDGQQRLTTLTLLLIFLKNRLVNEKQKVKISSLIFSDVYGKESFNIDVEERKEAMNALFGGVPFDTSGSPESVQNIVARYHEIDALLPEDFDEEKLTFFSDWLLQNVYLVEITAYTDEDAYTIFETMNDRGLSLSPLDMLKGYLLASISDTDKRNQAVNVWKEWSEKLRSYGKDEDSDAFKTWLRSQYAQTIRERKRGATARDFDKIGTEFHRWLKDNVDKLGLKRSDDFFNFINRDMQFFMRAFLIAKDAAQSLTIGLEPIHYNAKLGFTLQYPLLLAALHVSDSPEDVRKKMHVVSTYVDIFVARRIWNFKSISYSTLQYTVFNVMKEIRSKNIDDLVSLLAGKLAEDTVTLQTNDRLRLHQQNRYAIHHILARMTDFVEKESGHPGKYSDYIAEGKHRFEVEHIWANHPERHTDEFAHASDFAEYRNRIGGLLLLPKSFNASYGDLEYGAKVEHYFGQNLLAKSLHEKCYAHNPGFMAFIKNASLDFKAHAAFKKRDLDERQELYHRLAELIWSPDRLQKAGA